MIGVMLGYIGPGAGLCLIGALIALTSSIVGAIGMVVVYPLRKCLKKAAGRGGPEQTNASHCSDNSDSRTKRR